MAVVKEARLPKDAKGNDPNDHRNDDNFIERLIPIETTLAWIEGFTVSKADAEKYDHPIWAYKFLIIAGHIVAIVSMPNGGKTAIMMKKVAGDLSRQGYKVFYVNADVGQSDAKEMISVADENGYTLLLPDLKAGLSMDDVVNNLIAMNETGGDFKNIVFIFDTLKKMTDVINKSRSKELYKLFRSLSAKGMTIVLLAHTNKYNDADGEPIYEGTADLRSDIDELIYLIPQKNDDGSMTVSTLPNKVRGKFEPITFDISPDRQVTQREYVDVLNQHKERQQREADDPAIELITDAIRKDKYTEAKILAHVKESNTGIGARTVRAVLKRYQGRLWAMSRAFQNNAKQYHLIKSAPPL